MPEHLIKLTNSSQLQRPRSPASGFQAVRCPGAEMGVCGVLVALCGSSVGRERCRPWVVWTGDRFRGGTSVTSVRFGFSQQVTNPAYAGNWWNPMVLE